jgi:hypothetical protein
MTTHAIGTGGARRRAGVRGLPECLSLAAAPTFALMALLTGVAGGPQDIVCAAAQDASPLSGMLPMYVLMSAFHLGPWLKLMARGTAV